MSKRALAKERKLASIVEAAEVIFTKKGVQLSTMDDVAKVAGCSKATLYVYFPTKDELVYAVAKKGIDICQTMMRDAANAFDKGADKVRSVGYSFFSFAAKHPDYYKLISAFISYDTYLMNEKVNIELLSIDQILEECIELGLEDKSVKATVKPAVLSKCLWFMTNGLIQFLQTKGSMLEKHSEVGVQKLLEACFLILEESLAAEPQYRMLLQANPELFSEISTLFKENHD